MTQGRSGDAVCGFFIYLPHSGRRKELAIKFVEFNEFVEFGEFTQLIESIKL